MADTEPQIIFRDEAKEAKVNQNSAHSTMTKEFSPTVIESRLAQLIGRKSRYERLFFIASVVMIFTTSFSYHISPIILIFYETDETIDRNRTTVRAIAYSFKIGVTVASGFFALRKFVQKYIFFSTKYMFILYYLVAATGCLIMAYTYNINSFTFILFGILVGLHGWLAFAAYCHYFVIFESYILDDTTQDYMVIGMFVGWDFATACTAGVGWISYSLFESNFSMCMITMMIIYIILGIIYISFAYYLKIDSFEYLLAKKETNKIKSIFETIETINNSTNKKINNNVYINNNGNNNDNDTDENNENKNDGKANSNGSNVLPVSTSVTKDKEVKNSDDMSDKIEYSLKQTNTLLIVIVFTIAMLTVDTFEAGIVFYQIIYFEQYFIDSNNLNHVFLWTLIAALADIPIPPIIGMWAIKHKVNNVLITLISFILKFICLILIYIFNQDFISLIIICIVRLLNNISSDLMERFVLSEFGEFGITLFLPVLGQILKF